MAGGQTTALSGYSEPRDWNAKPLMGVMYKHLGRCRSSACPGASSSPDGIYLCDINIGGEGTCSVLYLSLPFLPPSSLMPSPSPEDSIPTTPSAPNRVLASDDHVPLHPPTLTNLSSLAVSPRGSYTPSTNAPLVPETEKGFDDEDASDQPERRRRSLFRRPIFWFAVVAAVVAVVLAVILPVYFTVIKKNSSSSGGGSSNGNGNGSGGPKNGLTTGGDGSTITMENGTEFTYHNPFGGFCTWSLFSSIGRAFVSQLSLQGFGTRKIRTLIMPSQTRGRLL